MTDLSRISRGALALAQHLRECWPVKGRPVTPGGQPKGKSFGRRLAMLIGFLKPLEQSLPANDRGLPTLEAADAVDSLRRACSVITRVYGLDRRVIEEPGEVPEIDPEVVATLEWAAERLRQVWKVDKKHPDGPDNEAYHFWFKGTRLELEIDPAAWRLLGVLWGKVSIPVPDLAEMLGKGKRTKYASLKPSVFRLNDAMVRAKLPFVWDKKRGQNLITYNGPPFSASVSE